MPPKITIVRAGNRTPPSGAVGSPRPAPSRPLGAFSSTTHVSPATMPRGAQGVIGKTTSGSSRTASPAVVPTATLLPQRRVLSPSTASGGGVAQRSSAVRAASPPAQMRGTGAPASSTNVRGKGAASPSPSPAPVHVNRPAAGGLSPKRNASLMIAGESTSTGARNSTVVATKGVAGTMQPSNTAVSPKRATTATAPTATTPRRVVVRRPVTEEATKRATLAAGATLAGVNGPSTKVVGQEVPSKPRRVGSPGASVTDSAALGSSRTRSPLGGVPSSSTSTLVKRASPLASSGVGANNAGGRSASTTLSLRSRGLSPLQSAAARANSPLLKSSATPASASASPGAALATVRSRSTVGQGVISATRRVVSPVGGSGVRTGAATPKSLPTRASPTAASVSARTMPSSRVVGGAASPRKVVGADGAVPTAAAGIVRRTISPLGSGTSKSIPSSGSAKSAAIASTNGKSVATVGTAQRRVSSPLAGAGVQSRPASAAPPRVASPRVPSATVRRVPSPRQPSGGPSTPTVASRANPPTAGVSFSPMVSSTDAPYSRAGTLSLYTRNGTATQPFATLTSNGNTAAYSPRGPSSNPSSVAAAALLRQKQNQQQKSMSPTRGPKANASRSPNRTVAAGGAGGGVHGVATPSVVGYTSPHRLSALSAAKGQGQGDKKSTTTVRKSIPSSPSPLRAHGDEASGDDFLTGRGGFTPLRNRNSVEGNPTTACDGYEPSVHIDDLSAINRSQTHATTLGSSAQCQSANQNTSSSSLAFSPNSMLVSHKADINGAHRGAPDGRSSPAELRGSASTAAFSSPPPANALVAPRNSLFLEQDGKRARTEQYVRSPSSTVDRSNASKGVTQTMSSSADHNLTPLDTRSVSPSRAQSWLDEFEKCLRGEKLPYKKWLKLSSADKEDLFSRWGMSQLQRKVILDV